MYDRGLRTSERCVCERGACAYARDEREMREREREGARERARAMEREV